MSEEIDARFLRSMLYEPLPGSAAVILVQLGIIEQGQVEALGQRTYDAECGRLSLALDDGRTVELERAMHLQSEDGYAVRIRSRAGQTISRSFIHIDRNLAVRNLHNDRMVYIDDLDEAGLRRRARLLHPRNRRHQSRNTSRSRSQPKSRSQSRRRAAIPKQTEITRGSHARPPSTRRAGASRRTPIPSPSAEAQR